jgi:hypothetical protein
MFISLVMKVKKLVEEVYAQREALRKEASEWLNSNKVETPKTRLNETEEERKEWERMERESGQIKKKGSFYAPQVSFRISHNPKQKVYTLQIYILFI